MPLTEVARTVATIGLLAGALLVSGCGAVDGERVPASGSPSDLSGLCTEEQLAEVDAATDELEAIVDAAGYGSDSVGRGLNILDEGCEEVALRRRWTSVRVDGETVNLEWFETRPSYAHAEPAGPPIQVGDVTVEVGESSIHRPRAWFACGEAHVSATHRVGESEDLGDDPRSRMQVDPWDGDPELLVEVVSEIAQVVECPAGTLRRDG